MQYSITLRDALLAALKTSLGATLQLNIFASLSNTPPATADAAVNMADATLLAVITANAGVAAGGTFGAPAAGVINKTGTETWESAASLPAFVGAQGGTSPLNACFFRLCVFGNNGEAGDTGATAIMQGTVGTVAGVFDLYLPTVSIAVGTQIGPISVFQVVDGNG